MSDLAAVAEFIYREARLMDEAEYDSWLALWAADGVYHVPIGAPEEGEGRRKVSIINDDYGRLEQRVDRLKSGSVLAVQGQDRAMRRVVSNVEIVGRAPGGEIEAGSNFILGVARSAEQQLWIGRTLHRLRETPDGLRIAKKTVLLINSAREIPLLQFLI